MTTQPTRDQLRALADAAAPGPWESILSLAWGDQYPALSIQPVDEAWDQDPAHPCCAPLEEADVEFIAAARTAVPQLLDQLDAAEQRIRDLAQEVRDERGAALDALEQIKARDKRIQAVRDVLDEPDAMIGARPHVIVDRIRRALDG